MAHDTSRTTPTIAAMICNGSRALLRTSICPRDPGKSSSRGRSAFVRAALPSAALWRKLLSSAARTAGSAVPSGNLAIIRTHQLSA